MKAAGITSTPLVRVLEMVRQCARRWKVGVGWGAVKKEVKTRLSLTYLSGETTLVYTKLMI